MYDLGTTTSSIAKKLQKAEIFVFVMVGLPHQGKSCEKAHNSQREQQNPTEGNEVNPVKERYRQGLMCFCLYPRRADKT